MAQAWIDIVETADLDTYIDGFRAELLKSPEIWLPFYHPEDIIQLVEEGDYQLWVAGKSDEIEIYGLTTYRTYPACKSVSILWCGGKNAADYYFLFTNLVEAMAKVLRADIVEIAGRPAWAKAMKEFGYTPHQIFLMKELDYGKGPAQQGNADK
jgi:hypothetical protein